jgi:alpha-D-ribose 1-methylphosphonate 5-triphosphate synthase subunit PhnG
MAARDSQPDPRIGRPEIEARRRAMALLARARRDELAGPVAARWPDHGARDLKPVETGLVMLRGRIGGDGAPFNLGEATVTRAVVELPTGERGFAHILGRDGETARLAAIADALWLREASRGGVEAAILAPIADRLAAETAKARAETAATRVDFFTLVRGEDAA